MKCGGHDDRPSVIIYRDRIKLTNPKVSPKLLSTPSFPASPTNQASGALNNKLVPIPPRTLPINNTPNKLLLVEYAPREYKSENANVPAFRP